VITALRSAVITCLFGSSATPACGKVLELTFFTGAKYSMCTVTEPQAHTVLLSSSAIIIIIVIMMIIIFFFLFFFFDSTTKTTTTTITKIKTT
jgi:hypothetical protein